MEKIIFMNLIFTVVSAIEGSLGIVIIHRIFPEFRYSNRILKAFSICMLLVLTGRYVNSLRISYISNLMVVLHSFIVAIIYYIFWKSKFIEVFLLHIFYYVNISILKLPMLTIRGLIKHENLLEANRGIRIPEEIIYNSIILLAVIVLLYSYKEIVPLLKKMFSQSKILLAAVIAIEWSLMTYGMWIGLSGFVTRDLIVNLLVVFCAATVILYLGFQCIYQQIKSEHLLRQTMYETLKKQYTGLKDLYEANSKKMHDVKHEFMLIHAYVKENDISGANNLLVKYLNKWDNASQMSWTGFTFLDFILNYKKTEIDKQKIKFELDVEVHEIPVSEEDLAIILGNLLDNAIEAAAKCDESQRYIILKICNIGHLLQLEINNSSIEIPKCENDRFVSSKDEQSLHGFGIESVKSIVEMYEGEILFQYDDKSFLVKILI